MARPRKTKEKEPTLNLAIALAFMKHAQVDKADDIVAKSHCRLANGYAVAFDGILAVGHPIDEELNVCPHSFRLIDALKRCKKAVSITQMDDDTIVIKSGKFRAVVPCLNPAALAYTAPDPVAGEINDEIKVGFAALNPLVSGTGKTTIEASLSLNNGSMVATDRHLIIEFWHGINLPNGLSIPKAAINAVCRIGKTLIGIGVSNQTVTFHYECGSWLRTQLYGDKWPDVSRILNEGDVFNSPPVPDGFFDAVEAVAPFSRDGAIHVLDECIASSNISGVGATYELKGITPGLSFNARHLTMIKTHVKSFDFTGKNNVSFFFGDNMRGAITQRKV